MDREQILNQLALLGSRPVKTPLGSLLEYVGLPRQRLENVLAKPFFQIGPQRPGQQQSMNALARDIAGAIPYEVVPKDMALNFLGQIKAYHGSPYKFEKFKNEAIGSGEGGQAFGYGHYLSESPDVAKSYATSGHGKYIDTVTGKIVDSRDIPMENMKDFVGRYKPAGSVYETAIHKGKQPGEYTYLRWDELVPDKILHSIKLQLGKEKGISPGRDRLLMFFKDYEKTYPAGQKGVGLYRQISAALDGDQKASAFLKRAGIDGIKYPSGSLSGVKSDKYNYVVFDPSDITIEGTR